MQNTGKVMHKHVGKNGPGPGNKHGEPGRNLELVMYNREQFLKSADLRDNHDHTQQNKHNQVDNDQLNVRIVVPLESVLKFFEHIN